MWQEANLANEPIKIITQREYDTILDLNRQLLKENTDLKLLIAELIKEIRNENPKF